MKQKLIIMIGTLLFANAAYSANLTKKPDKCPSVAAVAKVGFDTVEQSREKWIVSQSKSQYDTKDEWGFGVLMIEAENESEAITKANTAMKSMFLVYGPVAVSDGWTCLYRAFSEIGGIAHTPPPPLQRKK